MSLSLQSEVDEHKEPAVLYGAAGSCLGGPMSLLLVPGILVALGVVVSLVLFSFMES